MLKYNPHSKPRLVRGNWPSLVPIGQGVSLIEFSEKYVGTLCPVCDAETLSVPTEDQPDGSATGKCRNCQTPLRCNQHGFIFVDQ